MQTLAEVCAKTDWQVHAYCFMKTHFHLVIKTACANPVPGMKWLLSTYTIRFNRRHKVGVAICAQPATACIPGQTASIQQY